MHRLYVVAFLCFPGSQCGGIFSNPVGTLMLNDTDGRFGVATLTGIDCLWSLTAPENITIELYILQFYVDLGDIDPCSALVEVTS